jgi:hypothetical protein
MKTLLFTIGALMCAQAFAQTTPTDVCRRISNISPSNSSRCVQVISRSRLDQVVVDVAMNLANAGNVNSSLNVLDTGANRMVDGNIAPVCMRIATISSSNAAACIAAGVDVTIDPLVISVGLTLANAGNVISSLNTLKAGQNVFVHPEAIKTCNRIAVISSSNAANCITTIANMDFMNGSESICLNLANNGQVNSAINCLKAAGIEYNPYPPIPQDVIMSTQQFGDIQRMVLQAERLLARGNTRQATDILLNISRILNDVSAQNGSIVPPRGPRN